MNDGEDHPMCTFALNEGEIGEDSGTGVSGFFLDLMTVVDGSSFLDYCMVTPCLTGQISDHDYCVLINSRSQLNLMTLQQA